MELMEYLKHTFPGLVLKPSLYHQWENGLHFEFGLELYQFKDDGALNLPMFDLVYSQALFLFNQLFSEQDNILLVTNVYQYKSNKRTSKVKVYERYLKNKGLKYNLKQETLPYPFDEEEDVNDFYTSQFYLMCKKSDIHYASLIKASCHEDFSLKPKFEGGKRPYYPDVFFINITKNCIYYIYDDRGCEVIARNMETILLLYKEFNNWLDTNSRQKIERILGREG